MPSLAILVCHFDFVHVIRYMDYGVKAYSVVDWGVAWQHNCGSKVRCADNGRRYLAPRYML